MSNFSYDDFAVLVRSFSQDMLSPESLKSLRIVPLNTAPSMATAIRGTELEGLEGLEGLDSELNLPKEKNGNVVTSNVTVQHNSEGYCRIVGHIEAKEGQVAEGQGAVVKTAKAFVLYRTVTDALDNTPKKEVIAVASLKKGFAIGDVCYPSFTITTVNNYQSVAFNPNAFATVEDLINGLDGLHIAFDTASGDLKLLDKDGNVLDQANLPIKADVIIAEGEEGYKYVKTDVAQDIHAAKAWMPEGKTAWETVEAVPYTMRHAALVVEKVSATATREFVEEKVEKRHPISTKEAQFDHVEFGGSIYMVVDKTETNCNLLKVKGNAEAPTVISHANLSNGAVAHNGDSCTITNDPVEVDVIKGEDGVTTYVLAGTNRSDVFQPRTLDGGYTQLYTGSIETSGGSSADRVLGITPDGTNLYTFDENAETPSKILNSSRKEVTWFVIKPLTEVPNHTLKYGLEAFVWTVKGREVKLDDPFFKQLNASLLDLGFHEGDDIALGTNLATLAPADPKTSPLNGVDADKYMHGKDNKAKREQEVDTQRTNAQAELVAWNAQHPGLTHNAFTGTRISSGGVDIRDGKIEIGNGVANATDEQHKEDNVKRYVIETDIGDVARADTGLQIGVIDSLRENSNEPVQKDILTINAEDYISGAPTCLALLKCSKDASGGTVSASSAYLKGGRITANFTASGEEDNGVFKLTITDNRANNGFGSAPRIVEIIPVYKSGADATEAVPAQRSISAIAGAEPNKETGKSTLSIMCSQVIDWAQSIDLGGTVVTEDQESPANVMELYLIVKVY